jgi:hypothetical protein
MPPPTIDAWRRCGASATFKGGAVGGRQPRDSWRVKACSQPHNNDLAATRLRCLVLPGRAAVLVWQEPVNRNHDIIDRATTGDPCLVTPDLLVTVPADIRVGYIARGRLARRIMLLRLSSIIPLAGCEPCR